MLLEMRIPRAPIHWTHTGMWQEPRHMHFHQLLPGMTLCPSLRIIKQDCSVCLSEEKTESPLHIGPHLVLRIN